MKRILHGFDWNDSNIEKCQKHGVSISEIEFLFKNSPAVYPDIKHSDRETRYFAVGRNKRERYVFLSFTYRTKGNNTYIRPISARYMHKKRN